MLNFTAIVKGWRKRIEDETGVWVEKDFIRVGKFAITFFGFRIIFILRRKFYILNTPPPPSSFLKWADFDLKCDGVLIQQSLISF